MKCLKQTSAADSRSGLQLAFLLPTLLAAFLCISSAAHAQPDPQEDVKGSVTNIDETMMKRALARLGTGAVDQTTRADRSEIKTAGATLGRSTDSSKYAENEFGTGSGIKSVVLKGGFSGIDSAIKSGKLKLNFDAGGSSPTGSASVAARASDPIYGQTLTDVSMLASQAAQVQSQAEAKLYKAAQSLGFDEDRAQQAYEECLKKGGSTVEAAEKCIQTALVELGNTTFTKYVFDAAIDAFNDNSQPNAAATWTLLKEEFLDLFGDLGTKVTEATPGSGELKIERWTTPPRNLNGLSIAEKDLIHVFYQQLYLVFWTHCGVQSGLTPGGPVVGVAHCRLGKIDKDFDPTLCAKAGGVVDDKEITFPKLKLFVLEGGPKPVSFVSTIFSAIVPDLKVPDSTGSPVPTITGLYCSDLDIAQAVDKISFEKVPRDTATIQKMSRLKDKIFERIAILYARAYTLRKIITYRNEILALGAAMNNRENVRDQLDTIISNSLAPEETKSLDLGLKLETTIDDIYKFLKQLNTDDPVLGLGTRVS